MGERDAHHHTERTPAEGVADEDEQHEASITFLGFGLSPEQPAIGVILSEAMGYLTSGAWWLAVFPGAALLAVVLLFGRAGAWLRRMMSPEGVQA